MKNIIHIICFTSLLIVGCSCYKDNEESVTGTYESDVPSMAYRYITNEKYTAGSILEIKKDNSYIYNTCAQVNIGKWKANKDTLYLFCENIRFVIDSFNYLPKYTNGTICGNGPEIFIRSGSTLTSSGKVKGTTTPIYDKLKKVNN